MEIKISESSKEILEEKIRKSAKKVLKKEYTNELQRKIIEPKLKEVMKDSIDKVVINKPFKDEKGRYRYYVKKYGLGVGVGVKRTRPLQKGKGGGNGRSGVKYEKLGDGRTQNTTYKNMSQDRFMQGVVEDNTLYVYNNFWTGTSIFGTEIKQAGDEHLWTSWLVGAGHDDDKSNIVMPNRINKHGKYVEHWKDYYEGTDNKDYKLHWKKYCEDRKNRYEARDYLTQLRYTVQKDKFKKDIAQELQKEIIKHIISNLK